MIREGYKRLGDYIEPVDERNSDLSVKLSQGICNNKYFITPRQVAENSANDKIVRKGQFAYNRATTRNGDKISIAYREGDDCTVSSAYQIFRIVDEEKLNPYYLWMWFRRPEFDRYARFKSRGSAHEFFEWDEMCEVYLPVPDIATQRRIVAEYQAVEKRIATNEQLIANLEDTAQAIYKKMFIDDIDPEHLPDGWRMGFLSDIADVSSGKSLTDKVDSPSGQYIYPVAGASGIIGYSKAYNQEDVFLTTGRVGTIGVVNRYYTKSWTADNVLVIKSDYLEYSYHILTNIRYEDIIKGGVQALVTQSDLNNVVSIVPPKSVLLDFENKTSILSESIRLMKAEKHLLDNVKSLMLGKMSKL